MFTILLYAATAALLLFTAFSQDSKLTVQTDKGLVEGAFGAGQNTRIFKGIPFAAPPIGNLRWRPPQPAASWSGTRPAKDFGSHCYNTAPGNSAAFRDSGPSEDCLTLNVWSPTIAGTGTLPVMVWIHGGGFLQGGSSESVYDGESLARRGVVVVSMNYRLGILGFFVHPELTAESRRHASGDYGLMDQIAALEWVQRNIAAFGGDAGNVTVFGESAGSFAVSTLMASPLAKNLISKAIGESGAGFYILGQGYEPREQREREDATFAQNQLHATRIADLRKTSPEELQKAALSTNPPPPYFGPDLDGLVLPKSVPEIYATGKQAHIPLLAGWNSDEARADVVFAPISTTSGSFAGQAKKDFAKYADQFIGLYPARTNAEAELSAVAYAGDRFIAYLAWRWLEWQVKTGHSPVYRYFFNLSPPSDQEHPPGMGAYHGAEIPYVFGSLASRVGAVWRPEDYKLSERMATYWTNFARTGDPNDSDLPAWPQYDAANQWQVMYLNAGAGAKPDPLRARYLFLDRMWNKDKAAR